METIENYSVFHDELETHSPDIFITEKASTIKVARPEEDFVVSRTISGAVASLYKHPKWNLNAYATTKRAKRPFIFELDYPGKSNQQIINDWKWVLFLLFYVYKGGKSSNLSVRTLQTYQGTLRQISHFSAKNNCSIFDVLSNKKIFNCCIKTFDNVAKQFKGLADLLNAVHKIGAKYTGIQPLGYKYHKDLIDIANDLSDSKQTPVIPSRIYSELISQHFFLIDDYIKHQKPIISLLKKVLKVRGYGYAKSSQNKLFKLKVKDRKPDFNEAISEKKLIDYMAKYQITNLSELTAHLSMIQHACRNMIQCFSGMRENEADALEYECLKEYDTADGRTVRLIGRVTKMTGTELPQRWVTCEELVPVVKAAQSICQLVAHHIKIPFKKCPLFTTPGYFPFSKGAIKVPGKDSEIVTLLFKESNSPVSLFNEHIMIEDKDIVELEKIDTERAWREEEKFTIGQVWNLTSHQWRRSLAVYASESGMVSLTSLKRQLAHITKEMSAYYSRRKDAVNIVGDTHDAFWKEYLEEKAWNQTRAIQEMLHNQDQKLLGGYGNWLNKHRNKDNDLTIIEEGKKLQKEVKNGSLACKDTAVGKCMSTEPCDLYALRSLVGCLLNEDKKPCKHSIITQPKVEKLIMLTERRLTFYDDKRTVEYRTKARDLEILKATVEQF